jgi:hypothetical protein
LQTGRSLSTLIREPVSRLDALRRFRLVHSCRIDVFV